MDDNLLKRIRAWWEYEPLERACIAFILPKPNEKGREYLNIDLNTFWQDETREPDLESIVKISIERAKLNLYFGEAMPRTYHSYGSRGTPMTIAHYLGGKVKFTETTVWVEPIIKDWKEFKIVFNPDNYWWKKSHKMYELYCELGAKENILPGQPNYGDSLTVFSLLRGQEQLIYDIIDNPKVIMQAIDNFVDVWQKYHKTNWEVYKKYFPGDNSWLIWAPGKTCVCECDFSTMLSPKLFIEFVVPEIEKMGKYIEYIVWHLDGPDELKFLDILLELPQIKAIQWVPGAGKPTTVHWIPMLKKIQAKKKSLYIYATDETETVTLLKELSSRGLFISSGFTGKTVQEAENFLDIVKKNSHP